MVSTHSLNHIYHLKVKSIMKNNTTEGAHKDMQGINRRNFLTNTAMAGAGLILTPFMLSTSSAQPQNNNNLSDNNLNKKDKKMKTRQLGKLEVSELGLGCMNADVAINEMIVRPTVQVL